MRVRAGPAIPTSMLPSKTCARYQESDELLKALKVQGKNCI